jgi:hypothetical protein
MEIINTQYINDYLSVPTESKINSLLKRDSEIISTDKKYVEILIGSCIKLYGIQNTQKIIDKYIDKKNFFICQHIDIKYLNFGDSIVFTPHALINKNYISIPHYTVTSNYTTENKKTLLFSFVGSTQTHRIRKDLVKLFPNNCFDSGLHWGLDKGICIKDKDKIAANLIEYANKSKFSLCPRGTGISSIRLFEVMSMGSVPVIIADNYLKPLSNILNWDSFSITISEKNLSKIPEILSKIDDDEYKKMKDECVYIYNNYFSNENLHKSIFYNL